MTYIDELAADVERNLPEDRRPTQHASELYRLYALLVLTRGEAVTLEDVHNAWSTWMTAWNPDHGAIQPFNQLAPSIQLEDLPYADAIRGAARDRAAALRNA